MGIAEADPSLDVDGWDAAAKTAALANVLMRGAHDAAGGRSRRHRAVDGAAGDGGQGARRARPAGRVGASDTRRAS